MKSHPQILTVVHQETSTPGFLGRNLSRRGYTLDQHCPCLGDDLPQNLSEYAGVIVFGGPQSATDDDVPGIRAELDWLETTALPSKIPLLGICLGAWVVFFAVSRFVSVASIAAAVALPLSVALLPGERFGLLFWIFLFLGVMAIWKHRGNIKRLMDGTEPRAWGGKKEAMN